MDLSLLEQILDISNYATETRVSRRKGSGASNEFFTPFSLVKKMCDKIPEETWKDPNKTFLESSMGNGQFVLAILFYKIHYGSSWKQALETTFGTELMQDNVDETKQRILDMLDTLQIIYNKDEALSIMDNNLKCADFFKWNYEEWRPYTEEELNPRKKTRKSKQLF